MKLRHPPQVLLYTPLLVVGLLYQLIQLHLTTGTCISLPLPSPIQCLRTDENGDGLDCTVESYQRVWQDRKLCRVARAVYPRTEAQLIEAVASASRTGSRIKVVSGGSHSLNKLVCPGGENNFLISTRYYDSLIHIELTSRTVTAHSGVMLRKLLDYVAEFNLSLPHTPYWQGVSVGGAISTGSHGSGAWGRGSSLHDHVVGMRLVLPALQQEGYAKVVELTDGQEDLDAARLSLGVLGVISTVTFQLEPIFKRSVSLELRDDEGLEDEISEFAKAHEFSSLNWYPGTRKVLYKIEDRVDATTEGEGTFRHAMVEKLSLEEIENMRNSLELMERTENEDGLCEMEGMTIRARLEHGDGFLNDGLTFTGYPVVGYSHNMQTSGGCEEASSPVTPTGIDLNIFSDGTSDCEGGMSNTIESATTNTVCTCFWNPDLNTSMLFHDVAIAVPISRAKDAVLEIKKLRDLRQKTMCRLGVLGGLFMRFQAKSKAYLGEADDSVTFEFCQYKKREANIPKLQQDFFEEIEQMLLVKFGGKPHWGKNRILAFDDMHRRVRAMEKFLQVRERLDPFRLFSNEWTDTILGDGSIPRSAQILQDHCAIEGLCICREDSHCHPGRGFFCRPGYVFNEARVCRHEASTV